MSSYTVNRILERYQFFMDVSSTWWRKHRDDEEKIRKYVNEKFFWDYYPRVIVFRGKINDIDKPNNPLRRNILSKIRKGDFSYEFKPEEEKYKTSYLIKNGTVSISQNRKKQNAKLELLI